MRLNRVNDFRVYLKRKEQLYQLGKFTMMKMKEKYYFCFLFNHIVISNYDREDLEEQAYYLLQIVKNKKVIGKTNPVACQPNFKGQIAIKGEPIKFTILVKENQICTDSCEIRLIQQISGNDRLVGSYDFELYKYIKVNKELNRSCVEMAVDLSENFKIDYVVYMESTQQALTKIMQQHQTAKIMEIFGKEGSEQQDFLPQQLSKPRNQEDFKEIQFDLESPFIIHQRFWSPTRIQGRKRSKQNENQQNEDILKFESEPYSIRRRPMKLSKSFSTTSDNSSSLVKRRKCSEQQRTKLNLIERQMQQLMEEQDLNKSFQEMCSIISDQSNLSIVSQKEDRTQDEYQQSVKNVKIPRRLTQNKPNFFKIGFKNIVVLAIIAILVIIISFDFSKISKVHKKERISKRQKINKKHHKR